MSPEQSAPADVRRRKSLTLELVEAFTQRIRQGLMPEGTKLPTEAAIMAEFGVSRTVVREALSKLQAAGLVATRHGIGTFVRSPEHGEKFIVPVEELATIREIIAVLELRIGLEAEAAAIASQRRSDEDLRRMHEACAQLESAVDGDFQASADADQRLHQAIAAATGNAHFVRLMGYLGQMLIPRTRINTARVAGEGRRQYLLRVCEEHESIVKAIATRDAEGARAAMRAHLSASRERLVRAEAAEKKGRE